MKYFNIIFIVCGMAIFLIACQTKTNVQLKKIEESQIQWTGMAISQEGRMFVNYPRWSSDTLEMSVGEIVDGKIIAYPNNYWNDNKVISSIGKKGDTILEWKQNNHFVCVQSVYIDKKNRLWILDPANPHFYGVLSSQPKLYQVDLATDSIVKIYTIPFPISKPNSYLNDIRVDTATEYAFITDSNVGGVYVLNLQTGEVSLRLYQHVSTLPEIDILQCGKYSFTGKIHSDGIEISNDGQTLYYAALMGKTLYSVPTKMLIEESSDSVISAHVQKVATIPPSDGFLLDNDGNIWAGDLGNNAIFNVNLKTGNITRVMQDSSIRWADSFAKDKDGNIYFTTSQIHYPLSERIAFHIFRVQQ